MSTEDNEGITGAMSRLSVKGRANIDRLDDDLKEAVTRAMQSFDEQEAMDGTVAVVNCLERAHIFTIATSTLAYLTALRKALDDEDFADGMTSAEGFVASCKTDFERNLDHFMTPFLAEFKNMQEGVNDRLRREARKILDELSESAS